MNDSGVVAAVLNRAGSLGPEAGKRSRGELPLIALDQSSAAAGAGSVAALNGTDYRSFNLVLADRTAVWFVRCDDAGEMSAWPLSAGLHMVTAHDPDDTESPRVARHLPRFQAAPPPEPPDWAAWATLLADTDGPRDAALSVVSEHGFGTACASLVGLPATGSPVWLFAPGPAGGSAFGVVGSGEGAGRLL